MPECFRKLAAAIWTASWSLHSHNVRGFLSRGAAKISSCSAKSRSRLPQLFKAWLRSTIQLKVATRSSCTGGGRWPLPTHPGTAAIHRRLAFPNFLPLLGRHLVTGWVYLPGNKNVVKEHFFSVLITSKPLSGSSGGIRQNLRKRGNGRKLWKLCSGSRASNEHQNCR